MPRPTLPRWATGDTADIVEPSEGEKSLGWSHDDAPPAPYENWINKQTYDGLVHSIYEMPMGYALANCEQATPDASYAGSFNSVCFADAYTLFIAVGADREIQTSPEGITWTEQLGTGSTADFRAIAHGGITGTVVVGDSGEIWSSTDGTSWTQRTAAGGFSGTFWDVAWTGTQFVAVGSGGTIQTSPTGATWTARTAASSYADDFRGAAAGEGIIVIAGDAGEVQTSADGITWVRRLTGGSAHGGAAFGNDVFVTNRSWSDDGVTWTDIDNEAGLTTRVRLVRNTFVALRGSDEIHHVSHLGKDFDYAVRGFASAATGPFDVAYGSDAVPLADVNRLVVVGAGGDLFYSPLF